MHCRKYCRMICKIKSEGFLWHNLSSTIQKISTMYATMFLLKILIKESSPKLCEEFSHNSNMTKSIRITKTNIPNQSQLFYKNSWFISRSLSLNLVIIEHHFPIFPCFPIRIFDISKSISFPKSQQASLSSNLTTCQLMYYKVRRTDVHHIKLVGYGVCGTGLIIRISPLISIN